MKKQKQTSWPTIGIQILAIIGCGSGEITLTGCLTGCTVECSLYDEICCPDAERGCDLDHDEYTTRQGDAGCDDDPEINPGVPETCDLLDNNCDGEVDEDVKIPYYPDSDGDGYYGAADGSPLFFCAGTLVEAYATNDGDCNDTNSSIYPTAVEVCDGIDNNCDGLVDKALTLSTFYLDQDGDGFGLDDDAAAFTDCRQPEGYSGNNDDCNDLEPSIYPGAPELCDGRDNDCDGQADTEDSRHYFRDQDGDGFGVIEDAEDPTSVACAESLEYVAARGDCNDADSSIHPGADDPASDGIDQDCGLHDGPDAHVGFVTSDYGSLQDALTAAADGTRVWIGPGVYLEHDLSWTGKTLELWSTDLAEATVIDAGGAGGGLVLDSLPGTNVVDGVGVTNASGGSAISVDASILDVRHCSLTRNSTRGMLIQFSTVNVIDCTISWNRAGNGSAVYTYNSVVSVSSSKIMENTSTGWDGTAFQVYTDSEADVTLRNSIFSSNASRTYYGVAYIGECYECSGITNFEMQHCTIVGNSAMVSAIILANIGNLDISNNIIANNSSYNFRASSTYSSYIKNNVIYSPWDANDFGGTLDSSNSFEPPNFINFSDDRISTNDDLHLSPSSPGKVDDGSDDEWGVYGGEESDQRYYLDSDRDGAYDGWERSNALNINTDDATYDVDSDGLSNLDEFLIGTLAQNPDSDGDTSLDGYEINSNSDPNDWYSQPEITDATASVPLDFPSIQQAIDAVRFSGSIRVEPGDYNENIKIFNRDITLESIEGAAKTGIVGKADIDDSAMTVFSSLLNVSDFSIADGYGYSIYFGGGINMSFSDGSLKNLDISNNYSGAWGGGIAYLQSSATITNCHIHDNTAGESGGGLRLEESSPLVENCLISGNSAFSGAGMAIADNWGEIRNSTIANNFADPESGAGGGIILNYAETQLNHLLIYGNQASVGAGIYFSRSSPAINADGVIVSNSLIVYNSGDNAYNANSRNSPLFTHSVLYNPEGYANYNIPDEDLDDTNLFVEPGFLTYADADGNACTPGSSLECLPTDFHLALDSLLIDAGDPEELDPDGTISDIGSYGGIDADSWDIDGDGYSDYFWPGTITDAPVDFDPADYDCDDLDPDVQGCW